MSSDSKQTFFYREIGSSEKPALVLLHGLGMGHRMWEPQMTGLEDDFHLLVPDLPGLARSTGSGPFSVEDSAAQLLGWIRQLRDRKQEVYVCGLSLGAMVALEMVLHSRGDLNGLILSGGQVKPSQLVMLLQLLVFSLLPEGWILSQMPDSLNTEDPEIRAAAEEDATLTRKSGFIQIMKSAGQVDFSHQLSRIGIPTLVLCGEEDQPNLDGARALAEGIPTAELRIVPGVGHVWNLENPDLFNQIIKEFVFSRY